MQCTDIVVYSESNPFFESLKSDSRLFSCFQRSLCIQQRWESGGRGGTNIGFGASVYDASFILAWYLKENEFLMNDRSAVEIGCGPALVSIVTSISGNR
jgi:predicted nicotinamide N-methyase